MTHSKTDSMTTLIGTHRPWLAVLLIAGWCVSAPALALEDHEVRGEIVEVNSDGNSLRLEVIEAGADRSASAGSVETYEFDEDTRIRMEDPRSTVLRPRALEIGDLVSGSRVRLDFEEIDGRRVARGVSVEQEQASGDVAGADGGRSATDSGRSDGQADAEASDIAAMETSRRESRDSLPATASVLPLMATFGAGFAGLGLLLRLRRR